MVKILLLLLMVMSAATAFAQPDTENPQATKFDEFGIATNGYVKMKMDAFYSELGNNPSAQGVIINYGTDREIAVRERQIRDSIRFRRFDASRITMVNGGFDVEVKSQFWLVPPGAVNPPPEPTSAQMIDEYQRISEGDFKARVDRFLVTLANEPDSKGYIFNFGTPQAIRRQETRIKSYLRLLRFDSSRVTFKTGGGGAARTQFWQARAANR